MHDPAILSLAKLIRGISYVHPLNMVLSERRSRSEADIWRYNYLRPVANHASGPGPHPYGTKLLDMFCPAWRAEQSAILRGVVPEFSRAQYFVDSAGFQPSTARPTKLKTPQVGSEFSQSLSDKLGTDYTVVSPWARDPCRSMPESMLVEALAVLSEKYSSVVVLGYDECVKWKARQSNVLWYPLDFEPFCTRAEMMEQTVELVRRCSRVFAVDSFAAHLAGCLGKKLLSVDGPTLVAVNTKHYSSVATCKTTAAPSCRGCYYSKDNGWSPSCRTDGCAVIASVTRSDLESSTERAFG